mgnify:FL=1
MLQIKSQYKIAKRLGASIFEKTQSQKFSLSEARTRKVKKRGRGLSDFGKQMLEKQKVRYTYGLSEHQFRRYINEAMKFIDSPAALNSALELRLDNVVYRAGLASTRRAARQMVTHGHLTVNGRKMNTPSHGLKKGDAFAVRAGSKQSALFMSKEEGAGTRAVPAWIAYNAPTLSGTIIAMPTHNANEVGFDYKTVFEFYSR